MAETSVKRIDVKQEHIDNGKRFSHCDCPIALALSDVFDGPLDVGVSIACINDTYLLLPQEAAIFILNFDGCLLVEPFSFDLEIPCQLPLRTT